MAAVLPGIPLHLFGAKVDVLNRWGNRPRTVVWNGRFGTDIPFINAERQRLGLSQREQGLQIALPRYAARVNATFGQTLLPLG